MFDVQAQSLTPDRVWKLSVRSNDLLPLKGSRSRRAPALRGQLTRSGLSGPRWPPHLNIWTFLTWTAFLLDSPLFMLNQFWLYLVDRNQGERSTVMSSQTFVSTSRLAGTLLAFVFVFTMYLSFFVFVLQSFVFVMHLLCICHCSYLYCQTLFLATLAALYPTLVNQSVSGWLPP